MAKKKSRKSPQRIEYERQYALLKRRTKDWQKTHRILITDMPTKATRNYAKETEKIKNIKWKNISEQSKKEYKKSYDIAYEKGEIPVPKPLKTPYTPPTENDYYYSNDDISNTYWEDTPNEPADERAEIDAFIDQTIEEILNTDGITNANQDVKDILENLLSDLRHSLGDTAFYEYLSDNSTVTELTKIAYEAMSTSPPKPGKSISETKGAQSAIEHFAFVLNNHVPLDVSQARDLSEMLETNGAFGSVSFEFEDE